MKRVALSRIPVRGVQSALFSIRRNFRFATEINGKKEIERKKVDVSEGMSIQNAKFPKEF